MARIEIDEATYELARAEAERLGISVEEYFALAVRAKYGSKTEEE